MKKILLILFLFPLFTNGQLAAIANSNSGQQKAANSTMPLGASSTSTAVASNVLVVVTVAFDNTGGTDGDNAEVVSIISSDPGNITLVKAKEFTNGQGGAASGSTVSVWYGVTTGALSGAGGYTVNFSNTVTAKAGMVRYFSKGASTSIGVFTSSDLANDGADAGSITLSSLTNQEYLFIRACAIESNAATGTASTNFTNMATVTGTTGGGAAGNMWNQSEYRITTTTSQATDPTTGSADIASTMIAFYEFTPVVHSRRVNWIVNKP